MVTGGGRGLGMNLAKSLAEAGAKVLIASRDENSLRTAAAEISENSGGGQVLHTTVDLSNRDSTRALVAKATEILGKMAKAAAVELGPYRITVNCLVPGLFLTPMAEDLMSRDGNEIYDVLARVTAERRWGDPKELEGAILLLASEAGSYITGSELVVDGGMSSRNRPWD